MDKENQEPDEVKMEFETVLYDEMGHFGKFQIVSLLFLAYPAIVCGFMAGDYVFTAASLPHRCAIPECDGPEPVFAPDWITNAIPSSANGLDSCNRYNATDNIVSPDSDVCLATWFNRNTSVPCDSYVYGRSNTAVYDFDLACKEWLRVLPGMLNSFGGMIALALAGYISDRFGRKVSIVLFSFNIALVGVVRSFSVNFAMYAALQCLQTAIGGGSFSAAYILAAEIVGPKYRVRTSATMSTSFAVGQVFLGLFAYAIPKWRTLSLVLFTPAFLIVSYYWLITESPRWLVSKNKQIEGRAALEKAAHQNGRQIPEKSMSFLLTAISSQLEARKDENQANLILRIIKSPVMLRRCCTTPFLWITTTLIYYGLSINSVNLTGNMFFNYVATAAIEIPGFWTAVLVLDRIGRKATLITGFGVCSLCCFAFAFVPEDMSVLSLILYLTGKYCIGLVMTSLYLYTSELYPTRYRHSFLGFSSMLGRIGSIVSPLTPALMIYWSGIPTILFASTAFISAILVFTQPETLGLKVPDTFEEAEQLGKNNINKHIFIFF